MATSGVVWAGLGLVEFGVDWVADARTGVAVLELGILGCSFVRTGDLLAVFLELCGSRCLKVGRLGLLSAEGLGTGMAEL